MSSFGPKRKARIIQTLDDDDLGLASSTSSADETKKDVPAAVSQVPLKFGRSKPSKSSSLRKSININDEDSTLPDASVPPAPEPDDDGDTGAPVVVRPSALGRSHSLKKKRASTRLSFGVDDGPTAGPDDTTLSKPSTPKRTLGHRALENNALRRSASLQNLTANNLPLRLGGDEERPRYSKEYLEELQSSTPNTPQNLASLTIDDAPSADPDEMDLDPADLEGAVIIRSQDDLSQLAISSRPPAPTATILTEAQIRERKERRSRLAQQQKSSEYISLSASGSDDDRPPRTTISLSKTKKKKESRLIAEDEDLAEGYDEFVHDGGLALGRKAERAAARRHRQEMAELIQAAEHSDGDGSSDDSEAERRAAYEAAQRRAGMDGLRRPEEEDLGPEAVPRMKPLPKLNEVLQRMRDLVAGLEGEVAGKQARIADLQKEKDEILAREKEVQEILNQAGQKYQAVVGGGAAGGSRVGADVAGLASQSPLRLHPFGPAGDLPVERGLESFGATPTKRPDVEMT